MVPEWTRTRHFVNIEDQFGDPGVIMLCLTRSTLSVWLQLHNAHSLAHHWQSHLSGRLTYAMPRQTILLLCTGDVSYAPFTLLLISNLSCKKGEGGEWGRRALLPSPSFPCRDEVNSLCPVAIWRRKFSVISYNIPRAV
jgi:hypothetical protein